MEVVRYITAKSMVIITGRSCYAESKWAGILRLLKGGDQCILRVKIGVLGGELGWIGVVSGKAIFGPPLEEYWKKKLEEEGAKEGGQGPT
ncbi:hypothetical protein QJS10_CPA02g00084 [Acorus calamus]|uniref:Uncharacterized protein n=1 Tax=Acorus calamus TaxID=4465 RepID=A0AAV9FDI4_ACOCL|nr:hypothetical protein QJS10_CPA02g00084 [Acorus calamus]